MNKDGGQMVIELFSNSVHDNPAQGWRLSIWRSQ
ncbi:hypothetical protein BHMPCIPO_00132 [Ensifer sesbaniae]|nr:hypothetical protein [Ensifer sesbaniae]